MQSCVEWGSGYTHISRFGNSKLLLDITAWVEKCVCILQPTDKRFRMHCCLLPDELWGIGLLPRSPCDSEESSRYQKRKIRHKLFVWFPKWSTAETPKRPLDRWADWPRGAENAQESAEARGSSTRRDQNKGRKFQCDTRRNPLKSARKGP